MDTDFATTQARYADFLARTPAIVSQTVAGLSDDSARAFRRLVSTAHRSIFTGVGSSMPAAWLGANLLRNQGLAAQFLPTGSVLGMESLGSRDVVILCSQGVNRADALLVTDRAKASGAALVLLTANRAAELQAKAEQVHYFDPAEEKLFCRPAGVAANYALMAKLCGAADSGAGLAAVWQEGNQAGVGLPAAQRFIVLSSDEMMPAAWNATLALREGSGLHSELFDIETYGHGNYVGDLRDRKSPTDVGYVLIAGRPDSNSAKSVRRILPFVEGIKAPYAVVAADQPDPVLAGLEVLARFARYVYDRNQKDRYNMNRPPGKPENRYYHELDSYEA